VHTNVSKDRNFCVHAQTCGHSSPKYFSELCQSLPTFRKLDMKLGNQMQMKCDIKRHTLYWNFTINLVIVKMLRTKLFICSCIKKEFTSLISFHLHNMTPRWSSFISQLVSHFCKQFLHKLQLQQKLSQLHKLILYLNFGCLHSVACVRSRWGGFPVYAILI
jgi:hypothetical protein